MIALSTSTLLVSNVKKQTNKECKAQRGGTAKCKCKRARRRRKKKKEKKEEKEEKEWGGG